MDLMHNLGVAETHPALSLGHKLTSGGYKSAFVAFHIANAAASDWSALPHTARHQYWSGDLNTALQSVWLLSSGKSYQAAQADMQRIFYKLFACNVYAMIITPRFTLPLKLTLQPSNPI